MWMPHSTRHPLKTNGEDIILLQALPLLQLVLPQPLQQALLLFLWLAQPLLQPLPQCLGELHHISACCKPFEKRS